MIKRKKVVYIISDIDRALAFEWIAAKVNKEKITLLFILLNPSSSELEQYLKSNGFEVHLVRCRGKKDWLQALFKTYTLLKQMKPDAVHCHLIQANIIGLIAAKLAGIRKRIYSRHHSSLHHIYFPKGVWWDRMANKLATQIVAISGIVKRILIEWEKVPPQKVIFISHGFLLDDFNKVKEERIETFKKKYDLDKRYPVIGVISRFTEWKGVQYIIPAVKNVLKSYPDSVLLLLNAQGDYEERIKQELETIPSTAYRLVKFEKDIAAAYKAMDVFVHVPIDEHSEAFGQIYVEALAAGVPAVFTRSGIANEPFFNNEVAVMIDYKNSEQIFSGITEVLSNKETNNARISRGKAIAERFSLSVYIQELEKLYLS